MTFCVKRYILQRQKTSHMKLEWRKELEDIYYLEKEFCMSYLTNCIDPNVVTNQTIFTWFAFTGIIVTVILFSSHYQSLESHLIFHSKSNFFHVFDWHFQDIQQNSLIQRLGRERWLSTFERTLVNSSSTSVSNFSGHFCISDKFLGSVHLLYPILHCADLFPELCCYPLLRHFVIFM